MLSMITVSAIAALLKGVMTSAGLIMAIGGQNAFVLSQGLKREYHWPIAGLCSLFDAMLICIGVAGMGALISQSEVWMEVARWGGALFLFFYGAKSLRSALQPKALNRHGEGMGSLGKALLTTVAITLLNPHVYLDTVVLLGSIGGQYPGAEKAWFALGAMSFSFVWFFSLVWAAKKLQPLFTNPKAWQVLDCVVCLMMWAIALNLLWPIITSG